MIMILGIGTRYQCIESAWYLIVQDRIIKKTCSSIVEEDYLINRMLILVRRFIWLPVRNCPIRIGMTAPPAIALVVRGTT